MVGFILSHAATPLQAPEIETVARGKQLGWLDSLAGQEELLAHFTQHQAQDESGPSTA